MGKAKRLVREHDEAAGRLGALMLDVIRLYADTPLSLTEVVGNLEATKHLLLTDSYMDGMEDGGDEGDVTPFEPFGGTVRISGVAIDREALDRMFGEVED